MKNLSRNTILENRNSLSREEIIEKSNIIKERLLNSNEYKKAKTVMFYVSFGSEVHTHDMIKESLGKKKVCIPVLENGWITASLIDDFNELDKKNKYGVLEPSKIKKIDKRYIDLVIVPGVVFDKKNQRIGYGKGCYDNLLRGFKGKKVGLSFALQFIYAIPANKWDVKVHKVITEL